MYSWVRQLPVLSIPVVVRQWVEESVKKSRLLIKLWIENRGLTQKLGGFFGLQLGVESIIQVYTTNKVFIYE
jgi:hypothetical protein